MKTLIDDIAELTDQLFFATDDITRLSITRKISGKLRQLEEHLSEIQIDIDGVES